MLFEWEIVDIFGPFGCANFRRIKIAPSLNQPSPFNTVNEKSLAHFYVSNFEKKHTNKKNQQHLTGVFFLENGPPWGLLENQTSPKLCGVFKINDFEAVFSPKNLQLRDVG